MRAGQVLPRLEIREYSIGAAEYINYEKDLSPSYTTRILLRYSASPACSQMDKIIEIKNK